MLHTVYEIKAKLETNVRATVWSRGPFNDHRLRLVMTNANRDFSSAHFIDCASLSLAIVLSPQSSVKSRSNHVYHGIVVRIFTFYIWITDYFANVNIIR